MKASHQETHVVAFKAITQTYLERSQKLRKHQVKSPCFSSTTSACTQLYQPQTKAPINLCQIHSRKTSRETKSFKLHLACEILLQNKRISCSNLYRHWGRKNMQASLSCPISTLLHSLLYTYNSYILFLFTLQGKSPVLHTSDNFPNATPVATY